MSKAVHFVKYHSLQNGMRLVVVPSTMQQRVKVQMLYDVGGAHEEPSERGLAHLLEHMIFKGTVELPEGAVSVLAKRYGAVFNAFTGNDMTSYFFEVDSNNWRPFIPLLADCMENVLLDEQHLASEIKAVIQELRMRNDNPFVVMFEELFSKMLPEDHPYHAPLIGYKKDLAGLNADRLKAFYKKYYSPERATLFVVGDVQVEEVISLVEKYFSHIPASNRTFEPIFTKKYSKTLSFHSVLPKPWVKEHCLLVWPISAEWNDEVDLSEMTAKVLGEGASSLLHKRLIDVEQIADIVNAGVQRLCHEAVFLVYVQPRDGKMQACVDAIKDELDNLAKKPVEKAVLDRFVVAEKIRHEFVKQVPAQALLGFDVLNAYILTGSIDYAFTSGERLSRVTSQKISTFVTNYLTPEKMVRIDTVLQDEAQKNEWLLGQKNDQELEAQILSVHVRTAPYPDLVEVPVSEKYPDAQSIAIAVPRSTRKVTLENGIQVVIHEQKEADLCAVAFGDMRQYQYPGTIDSCYKSIIDGMIEEGSLGLNKQQILDWFADRGVAFSVSYGRIICLQEDAQAVIAKYLEILLAPHFLKKSSFWDSLLGKERELKQLFEKIKEQEIQRLRALFDDPAARATNAQSTMRYPHHSYGISLEEMITKVRLLTFEELPNLYHRFFNPNQFVVSVVGNVDSEEIIATIKSATAVWQGAVVNSSQDVVFARDVENIHVQMNRDQVYLSFVRESSLPAFQISKERVAVDLLSTIYFASLGSRIFKLRDSTGIFYTAGGVFASLLPTGFARTEDRVFALVSPEKLDQAIILFESFLKNVFESVITQSELESARSSMQSKVAASTQGTMALANYFQSLVVTNKSEMYRSEYLQLLNSLTVDDLMHVAHEYAQQGRFVRITVGNVVQ
ncbi:insulinase family protein [Candidatus Dependentiae bacterium]|nr:insulinase family protein [Candidatus Dependentiae bacterium]